jgi:hypothetical protein
MSRDELISTRHGLPVREIARYWARELKGTVREINEDRLRYELALALMGGGIMPDPDGWPPHLDEALAQLTELTRPHTDQQDPLIKHSLRLAN